MTPAVSPADKEPSVAANELVIDLSDAAAPDEPSTGTDTDTDPAGPGPGHAVGACDEAATTAAEDGAATPDRAQTPGPLPTEDDPSPATTPDATTPDATTRTPQVPRPGFDDTVSLYRNPLGLPAGIGLVATEHPQPARPVNGNPGDDPDLIAKTATTAASQHARRAQRRDNSRPPSTTSDKSQRKPASRRHTRRPLRAAFTWRLFKLVAFLTAATLVITTIGTVALTAADKVVPIPDVFAAPALANLTAATPAYSAPSIVTAADGSQIATFRPSDLHLPVDGTAINDSLRAAVLAAEDQKFFTHRGVDPFGIARAALNNATTDTTQGGSTITQQLVKNLYVGADSTFERKITEAVIALEVEDRYDKHQILDAYLNSVYFGENAYGAEAAAQTYYGHAATELTVAEATQMAASIPAPSQYNPRADPERSEERRLRIVDTMENLGFLTVTEAEQAHVPPQLVAADANAIETSEAFYTDYVRRWLLADGTVTEEELFGGGLTIETALVPAHQQAAQQAAETHVPNSLGPDTAAAVVDTHTGYVTAIVGGRDFDTAEVNLALGTLGGGSGRQPGSAFKPFVLAAAFAAGKTPDTLVPAPASYTPVGLRDTLYNYDVRDHGTPTLRRATWYSYNTPFLQLADELGPATIADTATRLGLRNTANLDHVPVSIATGAIETSPVEMAAAYATFVTGGIHRAATPVTKVTRPDGTVVIDNTTRIGIQALDPTVADTVADVLSGVVVSGTGRRARIGWPVAGKTGTSSDYSNAWFVGTTSRYAAAVWVGHPEGNVPMRSVPGWGRVTGGSLPATIWHDIMTVVHDGITPEPLTS